LRHKTPSLEGLREDFMFTLIKKEIWHILRDRRSMLVLFGMPIVQILLFGFALSNEVKDSRIGVLDLAHDESSQLLIKEIADSRYFDIAKYLKSPSDIEPTFRAEKIRMIMVIPANFDHDLRGGNHKTQISLIGDASDPNTATTVINYATIIINNFTRALNPNASLLPMQISAEPRMLYNPQLRGEFNFVPGVMAMILLLISAMMTSVAVVREKELGTMEVLLVSPTKPIMIILSKITPYLLMGLVNLTTILLLCSFALDLPIRGSLMSLYFVSTIYIMTSLALGLMISVNAPTQQIAMFISLTGLMMPTMLFSGYMFPIENLPLPMQVISNIVPAKWYFIIIKNIMIKGMSITEVWKEVAVLAGMCLLLIVQSLRKFKIRLE
jgi:ABC-2 type transport system permease protein